LIPSDEDVLMPKSAVPDEVVVAKLSLEAARVALEALFEKIQALPRSEKVIATDKVQEACDRLRAAQDVLAQLEASATGASSVG
jgi:hypothetical protein